MPRQIGWSQESNLLYTIGQQIDRLSQVVAANSGTGGLEEYSSLSAFPPTGTAGIIYLATDTNQIYYWNGFAYVEMSPGVSTNIYNSNGTLTGNRTVTLSTYTLSFTGDIFVNNLRIGRGAANDSQSVAIGVNALNSVTLAGANTAVGYLALQSQNTGYRNTAIGASSGSNVTTGIQNVFIGSRAGGSVTTGSNNIHIGYTAGSLGLTTGSYNVIIGSNLSGITTTLSNNIIIADGQGQQRINVVSSGAIGFGTGTSIDTSAKMQIDSTSSGFLPPRMTTAQRTAIATPAAGLIVYDTSLNAVYYYNGTAWTTPASGGGGSSAASNLFSYYNFI